MHHPDSKLREIPVVSRAFDKSLIDLCFVAVFTRNDFSDFSIAMNLDVVPFVTKQRFAHVR